METVANAVSSASFACACAPNAAHLCVRASNARTRTATGVSAAALMRALPRNRLRSPNPAVVVRPLCLIALLLCRILVVPFRFTFTFVIARPLPATHLQLTQCHHLLAPSVLCHPHLNPSPGTVLPMQRCRRRCRCRVLLRTPRTSSRCSLRLAGRDAREHRRYAFIESKSHHPLRS